MQLSERGSFDASSCIYSDRTAGRDCHHCNSDLAAAASRAAGSGICEEDSVQEQSQTDGLAMHNYEGTHGTFPPNLVPGGNFRYSAGNWASSRI